jgi:nucleolar complex protein 2
MAQSKSTKKFEKHRLTDTLKRRKEVAKIKQRVQVKEKQKKRKAKENEREEEEKPKASKSEANGEQFKDMTVDEFFQGGFEIPEKPKKKRFGTKDVPSKTGKRKRTAPAGEEDGDASSVESVEEFPVAPGSASEAESEEGDHEQDLEALKKKDPEFYKYMKENDPELLDFENADLAELDMLSEDEETPKKKRKTNKGATSDSEDEKEGTSEVTKAMISKWEKAMTEEKSLRALREVVLAFRAAAHLNEETGKSYKYRVSNPDGMLIAFRRSTGC